MTTSRRLWPPVLALAALLAGAQAARSEASPPQGEDPPGAEDGTAPSRAPHDGVIVPPEIGDEEIETGVPDPDAGHDEEVTPPPDMRDAGPDAAPR